MSVLMQKSPDWVICKELKLLYANNRLAEAVELRDLHEHMALTKLEKLVLKRAFKQLRHEKARERLKEWMVKYAMTGQDVRIEEEIARQERITISAQGVIGTNHPPRPRMRMNPIYSSELEKTMEEYREAWLRKAEAKRTENEQNK